MQTAGPCRRLCVTGGEPLLQQEALVPVAAALASEGFDVEVETNGTIDFAPVQAHAAITMDVKCPSSGEASDLALLARLGPEDAVKFVVADLADLAYMEDVLDGAPDGGRSLRLAGPRRGRRADRRTDRRGEPPGPVLAPACTNS